MCPESNLRLKKGCNEHVSTYHKLLIMMILSRAIYCVWKSLLMTVYRCFDYHAVVKFHSNIQKKGFRLTIELGKNQIMDQFQVSIRKQNCVKYKFNICKEGTSSITNLFQACIRMDTAVSASTNFQGVRFAHIMSDPQKKSSFYIADFSCQDL